MSDQENKTTWVFDLDTQEALEKALGLKNAVAGVGNKENFADLMEGLTKVGAMAGVLGTAYFALKTTFDAVFDAEQVNLINQQFDKMAESAGIAGDKLKESLTDAAKGLVDDTDLLKAANKAIVEMGGNAARLGEVMDLARGVTQTFGGNLVDRFEQINQAIATGSTRALRHIGIMLDQNKVYADYAKSIGVTVDALSLAGKQAAVMNAVLEEGKKKFGDNNDNVLGATNAWQRFAVAMKEIGETVSLVINKIFGPAVTALFTSLADAAKMVGDSLKINLIGGAEGAHAKVDLLNTKIAQLEKSLNNEGLSRFNPFGSLVNNTEKTKAAIADLKKELIEAEAAAAKFKQPAIAGGGGKVDSVDHEKEMQAKLAFEKELDSLRKARLQSELNTMSTIEEARRRNAQEVVLIEEDAFRKTQEIQNRLAQGKIASARQANLLIANIEKTKFNQIKAMELDLQAQELKALNNRVEQNKKSASAITMAWTAQSQKSKNDMTDMGRLGRATFDDLAQASVQAFTEIGKGQKSAGDIAKQFLFGFLGKRALAEGTVMLMSGIWPPNPAAIAGGGALIALGGFLTSQAGGDSGGSEVPTPSIPTSGGAPEVSGGGSTAMDRPAVNDQAVQQKAVHINIQGNYFDTDQSRMAIVQMVRDNQDATDFNVNKVGV